MRITALRVMRGHRRQFEIAKLAGLIPSRYNMIEAGKVRHIPEHVARRIAEALGVPFQDIFVPSSFMPREIDDARDQQAAAAGE